MRKSTLRCGEKLSNALGAVQVLYNGEIDVVRRDEESGGERREVMALAVKHAVVA